MRTALIHVVDHGKVVQITYVVHSVGSVRLVDVCERYESLHLSEATRARLHNSCSVPRGVQYTQYSAFVGIGCLLCIMQTDM